MRRNCANVWRNFEGLCLRVFNKVSGESSLLFNPLAPELSKTPPDMKISARRPADINPPSLHDFAASPQRLATGPATFHRLAILPVAFALLSAFVGLPQASAQTASLLRARGFNHSVTQPVPQHDWMQESDIVKLKNFGANTIRLNLFYYASYGSFATIWPQMRTRTIQKVQWCKNQGVKAVICFSFSPWDDQGIAYNTQAMWQRPDLTSTFCQLWQDIANDLAPNKDAVWAYDLLNEPNYGGYTHTPPQWRQLAIDEINTIHAIDPLAWCVYDVGPVVTSATLVPLPSTRVIYNAHFYTPGPFCNEDLTVTTPGVGTHRYPGTSADYQNSLGTTTASKATLQAKLQIIRDFQTAYNVPIYIGEFSASAGCQLPDSATWLTDVISIFEGWGWNWTYHAFEDAACWNIESFDTQRKAAVLAGLANNTPPDTSTVATAVPIVLEAENLTVPAYSGPTAPRLITGDPGFSNSAGSILDSTAAGQYVTYLLSNISAGSYDLRIGMKKNSTRGIWQLNVGRADNFAGTVRPVGSPVDESGATVYTEVDLGAWFPSTTSDKWFQFMITGKNASSTGYGECFDYIKLIPQ